MSNIEKINKIKYSRLKSEERFVIDYITDIEQYVHKDISNSIFYKKGDIRLFELEKDMGVLWCNYDDFWSVLESKYNLDYEQIKTLIKKIVEKYLIDDDITPETIA